MVILDNKKGNFKKNKWQNIPLSSLVYMLNFLTTL